MIKHRQRQAEKKRVTGHSKPALTYSVKIQKDGRLTVPAPIRLLLNLKVGDLLDFKNWRGKILATPMKTRKRRS